MIDLEASRSRRQHRRGRSSSQDHHHNFSSYISFSLPVTICIGFFLIIYIFVLLLFSPLLHEVVIPTKPGMKLQHGQVLQPVFDKMKQIAESPKNAVSDVMNSAMKKQLYSFRKDEGISDKVLMNNAIQQTTKIRIEREQEKIRHKKQLEDEEKARQKQAATAKAKVATVDDTNRNNNGKPVTGFMVLGMHRSGTSMLSGLLVNGFGYNPGENLIGGAFDNPKGFFELIDVVLQNDEFMRLQHVWWSSNIINYKVRPALEAIDSGKAKFEYGIKALKFLNNPNNAPYLNKDPRMCITLKTWLPLLDNKPAIVFTYRHPLEVAMSLKKREPNFTLEQGLRIWIIYNMRAIQNSKGLCRILSSNEAILQNPLQEVTRISNELTTKCNVPKPPKQLTQDIVDLFVDPNLQHNRKDREKLDSLRPIVVEYENGCKVYELSNTNSTKGSPQYELEQDRYMKAMKVFCDLKNGKVYDENYEWPTLS